MNAHNTNTATRTILAAALLAATAGTSLAQVAYNRTVRPDDITITPVAGSPTGGYRISLRPAVINKSGADVDLASDVVVTINDVPIASFARMIFLWTTGGLCTPSLSNCNGECFITSSCRRDYVGDCACHSYYDLVVPGPITLHNGDVLGLHIAASAGASPEVYTNDDSAYKTIVPPCPADINASGGLSVQDIFDFLAAYFANSPGADFNGSGSNSVQDIFDFLAAYFAGCV